MKCMKAILENKDIQNVATLTQASGHLKILSSASFVFWLNFFNEIMPFIDVLFAHLEKENLDIVITQKILTDFEVNISKIRNNLDSTAEGSVEVLSPKRRKIEKQEWKREAKEVTDTIIHKPKKDLLLLTI